MIRAHGKVVADEIALCLELGIVRQRRGDFILGEKLAVQAGDIARVQSKLFRDYAFRCPVVVILRVSVVQLVVVGIIDVNIFNRINLIL